MLLPPLLLLVLLVLLLAASLAAPTTLAFTIVPFQQQHRHTAGPQQVGRTRREAAS